MAYNSVAELARLTSSTGILIKHLVIKALSSPASNIANPVKQSVCEEHVKWFRLNENGLRPGRGSAKLRIILLLLDEENLETLL